MENKRKFRWGAWLTGLLALAAGAAWVLENLGILRLPVHKWWSVILILIGVLYLVLHRRITAPGGWFLIILGVVFLLTAHGIVSWQQVWKIWPAILVLFGLLIIANRLIGDRTSFVYEEEGPEIGGDRMRGFSLFGGITEKVTSKAFKGGIIYALFGGAFIDFRGGELDKQGAILDLFSTFGGITIRLPKNWAIDVRPRTNFGGVTNWTRNNQETSGKRLIIYAVSTFGGITLRN